MLRKMFLCSVVFMFAVTGCASFRAGRLEAYRALPTGSELVGRATEYTAVLFRPSPVLLAAEKGSAWRVVVRRPNGELEKDHWATLLSYTDTEGRAFGVNLLVAVFPQRLEALAGSRVFLLSHDALFCFTPAGTRLFCPNLKEFAWERQAPLLQEVGQRVRRGDETDQKLGGFIKRALQTEMVRRFGTSISRERYDWLRAQSPLFRTLITEATATGVAFGLGWAITQNPVTGAVTAGTLELMRLLQILLAPTILQGEEYGSAAVSRWALTEEVVQLQGRLGTLEERVKALEQPPPASAPSPSE